MSEKVSNKSLRLLIENEIELLFLKEQININEDDVNDTEYFDKTERYLDSKKKQLQNDILSQTKMKGISTIDQAKRVVADKQIQIDKSELQQLDDLQKATDEKKKEMEQQAKEAQAKATTNIQTGITPIGGETTVQEVSAPIQVQKQPVVTTQPIKKKIATVHFDVKTEHPFDVKFSERGFVIGDTRLSFEILETSLSKNFNIVLDGGKGLVLDAIRMQKILKYKDRF